MKLKNILMLILALCLVFSLVACGETKSETPNGSEPDTTTGETEGTTEADDGKVTYTVYVEDEDGEPIESAMVQLCLEACIPGITNAEGKAIFTVDEADYKVSFVSVPEGYTCENNEFHFEDGERDMTITLKTVS